MVNLLPPELQDFVRQELASGKYESEADVVCEGLRLLRERERRLEALREELRPALEQLDRGEREPMDAEAIKAEGRRQLAERGKAD